MKEFNTTQFQEQFQLRQEESTVSLFVDPDSGDELPSPDELRSIFNIADGDDYRDYGDLKIIGLGGMGRDTVNALKLALLKKIGSIDPKYVQLRVIDTDAGPDRDKLVNVTKG